MIDHIGSKPAPGRLRLIQAFINTAERESGREDLDSPRALGTWLAEHHLLIAGGEVGESDLRAAVGVREAFRQLALSNNGAPPDPEALEALNRMARSSQMTLSFVSDAPARLEPRAPGVDGAVGQLLAVVFEAMVDGSWNRLKTCPETGCLWAFYDHSKNRSGTWCSMAVCGNRHKARDYRVRKLASGALR